MKSYDITFIGNYTKDTISDSHGVRVVDGGAFNYGANVAVRFGLKACAITRLSRQDTHVVERLQALGIDVFPHYTAESTQLRLMYPGENPDERQIFVDSSAGSFCVEQVTNLNTRTAVIGASFRGEVGLDVLHTLKGRNAQIALDVQGFLRCLRNGMLVAEAWPEKEQILSLVQFLKADIAEAEILTGSRDLRRAAEMLFNLGSKEILLTHRHGVLVYDGRRFYEAAFYPSQLVGRSGRGDTCIAAYSCRRLDSAPAEAVIWAAAVTSLKMESNGPFSSSLQDVEGLIRRRYVQQT